MFNFYPSSPSNKSYRHQPKTIVDNTVESNILGNFANLSAPDVPLTPSDTAMVHHHQYNKV